MYHYAVTTVGQFSGITLYTNKQAALHAYNTAWTVSATVSLYQGNFIKVPIRGTGDHVVRNRGRVFLLHATHFDSDGNPLSYN